MTLPIAANTTCDVYRHENAPPAAPDVASVSIFVMASFDQRQERGESRDAGLRYTHVVYCDLDADIRDGWNEAGPFTGDTIYVPDKNGTPFLVTFVERSGYGDAANYRRVYVDRKQPTWPTNEL